MSSEISTEPGGRSWTHVRLDRRSPAYWRVTFDHLPINTTGAISQAG